MRHLAAIILFAVLSCRPAENPPAPPPPPPPPAAASQDSWRALGNEPFWRLDVTSTGLRFITPDDTVGIIIPPVASRSEGDTTRWTGATERTAFDVRIWPATCSDGMSDRVWPATALVLIDNRSWRGCAQRLPWTFMGAWRVTGHRAPGVSAMSPEEAAAWIGRTAEYSGERARFGTEECATPEYVDGSLTAEQFAAEFGVTVTALELEAPVTTILARCRGDWTVPGNRLIVRGPDAMYAVWDGVFFELERGGPR